MFVPQAYRGRGLEKENIAMSLRDIINLLDLRLQILSSVTSTQSDLQEILFSQSTHQ